MREILPVGANQNICSLGTINECSYSGVSVVTNPSLMLCAATVTAPRYWLVTVNESRNQSAFILGERKYRFVLSRRLCEPRLLVIQPRGRQMATSFPGRENKSQDKHSKRTCYMKADMQDGVQRMHVQTPPTKKQTGKARTHQMQALLIRVCFCLWQVASFTGAGSSILSGLDGL